MPESHPQRRLDRRLVLGVRLPLYASQPQSPILRELQAVLEQQPDHVGSEMGSLESRERDDESDFEREVYWGGVQETYDPRRGRAGFEDLIIRGEEDEALIL